MSLYHSKTQESIYNEKMGGDFGQRDRKSRGILANQGEASGEEEKERNEAGGKKAVSVREEWERRILGYSTN